VRHVAPRFVGIRVTKGARVSQDIIHAELKGRTRLEIYSPT
jgi:hypothetical protein